MSWKIETFCKSEIELLEKNPWSLSIYDQELCIILKYIRFLQLNSEDYIT